MANARFLDVDHHVAAISPIDVVLVAYRSDPWIEPCLRSLLKATDAKMHLLLVDNTENTKLGDLDLETQQQTLLQTDRLLGFAAANNHALQHLGPDSRFVVFLNQDTLSDMDWIVACVAAMDAHTDYAAVTPLTKEYSGDDWERYFLECALKSAAFSDDLEKDQFEQSLYDVPVIPAAAMVVRTSALREVGPFDPVFGSYYEDYDLCHRLRRAGHRVGVCSAGTVRHHGSSATPDVNAERRRARWVLRNRLIVRQRFESNSRVGSLLRYWVLEFPRGLLRSLLGRVGAKPLGPYLKAHWDLVGLTPRLASRRADEAAWRRDLDRLGWPKGNPSG